jgi:hypothetical protein
MTVRHVSDRQTGAAKHRTVLQQWLEQLQRRSYLGQFRSPSFTVTLPVGLQIKGERVNARVYREICQTLL